jgi:hypothetical protein
MRLCRFDAGAGPCPGIEEPDGFVVADSKEVPAWAS